MLEVMNVAAGYPGPRGAVLANLNLTLRPGAFICVIGRNGAGKSTLLRTISGLQKPLGGRVCLHNVNIHEMTAQLRAQRISVVTTERVSSPGLRVRDVINLGRQPYTNWRGHLSGTDYEVIADAMRTVDVLKFANQPFDSLSDGERQRVMIARALAQDTDVMVLDEITAFLDLPGRVEVMSLLRTHAHTMGKIVLLSSHDLELSLELADRLWIVDEGKVKAGIAEDGVILQAIANAFDTKNVRFEPAIRQFRLRDQPLEAL
ncbi:ABC transporter ATP-binding protein [Bowmanella denitrificans]|nr:ABC transporter ATP-binding protein [Bowmanella denitrificans]